MVNTVTQTTLLCSGKDKNIIRRIKITSDGSEETNTVVYSNAAFCATPSKGTLMEIWALGADSIARLSWDQTTDVIACSVNPGSNKHICFRPFGGLPNPNGTGATGDLLLSTANLDAGDEVTLILWIT